MQNEAVWEDLVIREIKPVEAPKTAPTIPQNNEKILAQEKERLLSAYMTHELRAPLTSIRSALGILEMQLTSRLAPEEAQILKMAMRNADRLGGLINDIMDYSKVRAGKMTLDPAAVRPEELINEAVESLRSWAVAKGIRMRRIESEEPLPRIYTDGRRMVQVLTNLLSNAIKFTPQGGKIDVSARLGTQKHAGTVVFRVQDSGPGIPKDDIKKIFNSFEQSALGVKAGAGTGLGLTLSQAMVELQGGLIWAESWRGLGASFLFTSPILRGDATNNIRPYPKSVDYHGIFVNVFRRMNTVVAALFG